MSSTKVTCHSSFLLDSTMIYLNPKHLRKRRTRSVLTGKWSIGKLPPEISEWAVRATPRTPTTAAQLLTVVVTGKDTLSYPSSLFHPSSTSSTSKATHASSSSSHSGANDTDAQKRFSNAKAISSDQFFNKDSDVRMWASSSCDIQTDASKLS